MPNIRSIRSLVLTISASLAACGCFVSSTSPVGTSAVSVGDPALAGLWTEPGSDEGGRIYLTFFPRPDSTYIVLMQQIPAPRDHGGWSTFAVRPAQLGSWHYIDAQEIEQDGKAVEPGQGHVPVFYSIGAGGQLSLSMMDEAKTKEAIRAGRIAGRIEPGQFGDAKLTAMPAALDRFLQTDAGHALFVKPFAVLERVK